MEHSEFLEETLNYNPFLDDLTERELQELLNIRRKQKEKALERQKEKKRRNSIWKWLKRFIDGR